MYNAGVVLEDDALRDQISAEFLQMKENEGGSESCLSWEELTDAAVSLHVSEGSGCVVLYDNQSGLNSTSTLVLVDPCSTRSLSPQSTLSGWEISSIWNMRNKFVLTSQSFKLPWSLEAVIRPESPVQQVPKSPDITKPDEEEPPKKSSVVAKTVRLPVALASDMLIFFMKLMWPKEQSSNTDIGSATDLIDTPFYQIVM